MFEQFADYVQDVIDIETRKGSRYGLQEEQLLGIYMATVVDTLDPLKQGRVRYYSPLLFDPNNVEGSLRWASPISAFGGFDDSGSIWVPPAGSKIIIAFLNGSRDTPFYLGTVWNRNRGSVQGAALGAVIGSTIGSGQSQTTHLDYWGYPVQEYQCLWEGRRDGYMVGSNAGDQVFPPWNTEMYNGYDIDSVQDFYSDTTQINSTTYPYIKGIKTEEKHMLKFVEGDPRCNKRWKRVELASGRGNWIMLKDDHLHAAGQWAHGYGAQFCHKPYNPQNPSDIETPLENPCCNCDETTIQPCFPAGCMPKKCPTACLSGSSGGGAFQNPYYKRYEEMRPHWGANTPQGNRCMLTQSGIQMQSIGGHQVVLDDSVNQPTGVPTWDRDFDFGCDDTCRMKMWMKSSTGHVIEMNDWEDVGTPKIRGEENGINMRTANGNFFELNDHTVGTLCVPEDAGDRRGITMFSTSTHLFQMNDSGLKGQSSQVRMDGGVPKKADKHGFDGYIILRSGYGLQLLMKDDDIQTETNQQFIQLLSPQVSNTKRGVHMLAMQEQASGPGVVMLRAGGVYYQASYDETVEVVGDEKNPASKFTSITNNWLVDVKDVYFNHNGVTIYQAKDYIFMLAGLDLPPDFDSNQAAKQSLASQSQAINNARNNPGQSTECSPGLYNVIVSKDPWACPFTGYVHFGIGKNSDSRSFRVFASAQQPTDSPGCSVEV